MVKPFVERQLPPITDSAPKAAGAELVNDDTLCATCHESYVKFHRTGAVRLPVATGAEIERILKQ